MLAKINLGTPCSEVQKAHVQSPTPKILTKPSHSLEPNFLRYLPAPWSTRDPVARSTQLEMTVMSDHAWKRHLPASLMAAGAL